MLASGLLLLAACANDDEAFDASLPDEAYPLEAMLLPLADLPIQMESKETLTFANEEWASLFDVDELEGKISQLESRGRINGALRTFGWENEVMHLGEGALIRVQSTLYRSVESASASLSLFCGTLVDESTATDVTEFTVGAIGDGSQGLLVGQRFDNIGRFVETIVCFRTGRVVHAVTQSGLNGTEDIALTVRTARRMHEHVRSVLGAIEWPPQDADS